MVDTDKQHSKQPGLPKECTCLPCQSRLSEIVGLKVSVARFDKGGNSRWMMVCEKIPNAYINPTLYGTKERDWPLAESYGLRNTEFVLFPDRTYTNADEDAACRVINAIDYYHREHHEFPKDKDKFFKWVESVEYVLLTYEREENDRQKAF